MRYEFPPVTALYNHIHCVLAAVILYFSFFLDTNFIYLVQHRSPTSSRCGRHLLLTPRLVLRGGQHSGPGGLGEQHMAERSSAGVAAEASPVSEPTAPTPGACYRPPQPPTARSADHALQSITSARWAPPEWHTDQGGWGACTPGNPAAGAVLQARGWHSEQQAYSRLPGRPSRQSWLPSLKDLRADVVQTLNVSEMLKYGEH